MLLLDGQVHPDTLVMHLHNYVIGVSNNVIVNRSTLGNSVSVHKPPQADLAEVRELDDIGDQQVRGALYADHAAPRRPGRPWQAQVPAVTIPARAHQEHRCPLIGLERPHNRI